MDRDVGGLASRGAAFGVRAVPVVRPGCVRPVGRRAGGFAWFGQGRNEPMMRLHGSGYRRRAVRMRMPRRYRVLLWALALAVVGVTAGALLAQAGG